MSGFERVMNNNNFSFEVIFIQRLVRETIRGKLSKNWLKNRLMLKALSLDVTTEKSPALYCGFKEAQGDVVITMDADLQDSPTKYPSCIA